MAITLVGSPAAYTGVTDAFSVDLPPGLADGDYVLVQVISRAGNTPTEDSGTYTLIGAASFQLLYAKMLGPGDVGATTVSFTGSGTDATIARTSVWRGVHASTPYESLIIDPAPGTGSTTRAFPDITTTGADRMGLAFGCAANDFFASSFSSANGWSDLGSFLDATTLGNDATLWHFQQAIPSATTVIGAVIQSGAGNMFVDTVDLALIPAPAGTNVPVTDVSATGAVGDVTVEAEAVAPVTGVSAAGALGTVSVAFAVAVTGVEATGALGTVEARGGIGVGVSSVQAAGALGEVNTAGGVVVLVTSVTAVGIASSVLVWSPVPEGPSGNWVPVVTT